MRFNLFTTNLVTVFSQQMDSVGSSDNGKEHTRVKGKVFKSPGKLFSKKSTGHTEGTDS